MREKLLYFCPGLERKSLKVLPLSSVNVVSLLKSRRSYTGEPELSNPMTTANCPGNEELDFRLIFGEDGQQPPLGPAGQCLYFGILSRTVSV